MIYYSEGTGDSLRSRWELQQSRSNTLLVAARGDKAGWRLLWVRDGFLLTKRGAGRAHGRRPRVAIRVQTVLLELAPGSERGTGALTIVNHHNYRL